MIWGMTWKQMALLILMGYAVNAFILSIYGDELREGKRWILILRLTSLVPFGSVLIIVTAMLAVLSALILLSIPFCIVSGIIALWKAWSALSRRDKK